MEEFTVSIFFKIIFIACIAGFTGLELYFFVGDHPNAGLGLSLCMAFLLFIIVILLISRLVRKVIISADNIISVRLYGQREILTSNVKGFRFKNTRIIIEPFARQP